MPVKMGVDPEQVKAPKPVQGGWYDLKLVGFKPKMSKDKGSLNLNANLVVVNAKAEENDTKVYMGLNSKFARAWADFAHGFGFPLNPDGTLPGDFIPDDKDKENVEKYQYKGPLLGKILHAELIVSTYQGNERNEVNQIRCKVDGCATKFPDIKHLTKMAGNS